MSYIKRNPLKQGITIFAIGILIGALIMNNALVSLLETSEPKSSFNDADVWVTNGIYPKLAVDSCSGTIYAVWQEDNQDTGWDVMFSKSSDGGRTWISSVRVNDDSSPCGQNWHPEIATNENTGEIYVVWQDNRNTGCPGPTTFQPDIRFSKSSDGGQTWGDGLMNNNDVVVNDAYGDAKEPAIAVDTTTSAIYVAWADNRWGPELWSVRISKSIDGGTTWGDGIDNNNDVRIDDDTSDNVQANPSIGVNSVTGEVHAVWHDNRQVYYNVFYSKSTDGGSTWGDGQVNDNDVRIDDPLPNSGFYPWRPNVGPSIVVDENNGKLYTIWHDNRQGIASVYISNSTDGGATWGDGLLNNNDVEIPDDFKPHVSVKYEPSLTIDAEGNLHATWRDERLSSAKVFFSSSSDGGGTWGDGVRNSNDVRVDHHNDTSPINTPVVAADKSSGSVHVIWSYYGVPDGIYFNSISGELSPPDHPFLYVNKSLTGNDIMLNWTDPPPCSRCSHYLIFKSETSTGFDFDAPWINTSVDVNPVTATIDPLNTQWVDEGASEVGHGNYGVEGYYIVVTISSVGARSTTSNTVGYYTMNFSAGLNTFSLPLKPQTPLELDSIIYEMGAATGSWLDNNDSWQTFPSNPSSPLVELGEGYVAEFDESTSFAFVGEPASMIIFKEGFGFGESIRDDISAYVDTSGNVEISWTTIPDAEYYVYWGDSRNGFFNNDYVILNSGLPIAGPPFVHSGAASSQCENYYMIVPFDPLTGTTGSGTYSIGVITREFNGNEMFGVPLKPVWGDMSADWYADQIPNCQGIVYLEEGIWKAHFKVFPEGIYDPTIEYGRGYELSVYTTGRFSFVGW